MKQNNTIPNTVIIPNQHRFEYAQKRATLLAQKHFTREELARMWEKEKKKVFL